MEEETTLPAASWVAVVVLDVVQAASRAHRDRAARVRTVRDTLRFKVAHEDLTTYNAVQKVLYIVVILAGISQVVTGLAIWKPVQFSGLTDLLGGFQAARLIHFGGMAVIVGFLVVHVALSLLVPSTLWAMLTGGPRLPAKHLAQDARP